MSRSRRGRSHQPPSEPKPRAPRFTHPVVYKRALDDVVGQEEMKVKLASAFSQYTLYLDDPLVGRPVVLVYGPSGSGKTYSVEKLAKASGLPFTVASSAAISPPSYKGLTLRDILIQHYFDYHTDEGVIFLDEIDKWCKGAVGTDAESVSMGVRSQAEILRMLEKETMTFIDDAKDYKALRGVEMQTSKLMWVLAGAFVGLERLIKSRLHNVHYPPEDVWTHALPEDFVRYGMVPELVNRVGTWSWVKPLTRVQIMEILALQERPVWVKRFTAIGCELDLEDGALGRCAQDAFEQKTFARGAAALLRRALDDIFVRASEHDLTHVRVDASTVITGRLDIESQIA